MIDPNQPVRWQHVVLIFGVIGFLAGAILLGLGFTLHDATRTPVCLAGGAAVAVSAIAMKAAWSSLRRSDHRSAAAEAALAGAFELGRGASAAASALNVAVARHFGLPLSPDKPPMPATFGALAERVARLAEASAAIAPGQLRAVRDAVADAIGKPAGSISWGSPLADLFPPGRTRHRLWNHLRAAVPGLPQVTLNPWLENIAIYGLLAALIAIAVPIAQSFDRQPEPAERSPIAQAVGRKLGLVLFAGILAVLMIPVHLIGRRYASRLPAGLDDLPSLSGFFPQEAEPWRPALVTDHLRELVSYHLGMPLQSVSNGTPLFAS